MSSEVVDWNELQRQAEAVVDPAELKRKLDLVAVCEEVGIVLEPGSPGKWHGLCPFHDDSNPSLDVYVRDDGEQRVGCMACDFGNSNDVFDLLQALRGYRFTDALKEATELVSVCQWTGERPKPEPRQPDVDFNEFARRSSEREDVYSVISQLLLEREIHVPAEWVRSEWHVGVTPDQGGVVIPHFTRDGGCNAIKTRRATVDANRPWKPMAMAGSRLTFLYGAWRCRGHKNLLLVEGESDAWVMSYLLRGHDVDVLALPSGAAARPLPEWIQDVNSYDTITLMFDGDESGRLAVRNWQSAIGVTRVAILDEGEDAASADHERALEAYNGARAVGLAPEPGLVETTWGGLARAGDQDQKMVANFTIALKRTVALDEGGFVYYVTTPNGREVPIENRVFQSDKKLADWASDLGYTWHGTTKDARELGRWITEQVPYHPFERGVRYAGLVGETFVLPEGESIGRKGVTFVPPVWDVSLDEKLFIRPGPWEPDALWALSRLNEPAVITPVIGWICAAPLRSTFHAFPTLHVVGSAGTGKSSMLEAALGMFGYRTRILITNTTELGISSHADTTNAYPMWYDEYRNGVRPDSKLKLEQIVRDGWDMGTSFKGGIGEQKQALTRVTARAPMIVSGEEAFAEASLIERSVIVHMPLTGRNPEALSALVSTPSVGIGRAYLEWVLDRLRSGVTPAMDVSTPRAEHSRNVAAYGYALFRAFAREVCGVDELPAYDGSLPTRAHAAYAETPPIVDVIRRSLDKTVLGVQVAWIEDGQVAVRVPELVQFANSMRIPVSGNLSTIEAELGQRYGARHVYRPMLGSYLLVGGALPSLVTGDQ